MLELLNTKQIYGILEVHCSRIGCEKCNDMKDTDGHCELLNVTEEDEQKIHELFRRVFSVDRQPYNGTVVCLENSETTDIYSFTPGRVYIFIDGIITDDDGHMLPDKPVHSFREWQAWSKTEFIEVDDGKD